MQPSRRIHPANNGRISEPVLWGFEGRELLIVTAGFGISLACFRFLYATQQWNAVPALAVAALPLVAAIAWILLLVSGKPKRHAGECLEWLLLRIQCRSDLPATFLSPTTSTQHQHPILDTHES
ncbi:MAG: hypothetical protein KDN22_02935 [Verrucomicrobiae bacterium]|nr:hypothetical protein [Verrucomicrobiae bacterium]